MPNYTAPLTDLRFALDLAASKKSPHGRVSKTLAMI